MSLTSPTKEEVDAWIRQAYRGATELEREMARSLLELYARRLDEVERLTRPKLQVVPRD